MSMTQKVLSDQKLSIKNGGITYTVCINKVATEKRNLIFPKYIEDIKIDFISDHSFFQGLSNGIFFGSF